MTPDFEWLDLLPGTYLVGLAWLLAATLKRWYDPVPRRAVLTFGVVLVLLFGEVLFLGKVLLPLDNLRGSPPFQDLPPTKPVGFHLQVDQLEDFAPYYAQVRRTLAQLEWPLLNPLVGAGEPLLVNTQAQHFHPFMVLTYPFPLASAVGLIAALKLLFAFFFSFVLFRRLGLGETASIAGGLAYGFGGFMLLYLGWPHTQSAAFLPLLLYALELAIGRRARQDLPLLGLAVVGLLLGGHPETILYVVATALVFAAARLAAQEWRERWLSLLRIALIGALSVGVAAPVLVPTAVYLRQSERYMIVEHRRQKTSARGVDVLRQQIGTREARAEQTSLLRKRALPVVAPNAFGNNRWGPYWGASAITQDSSVFAGSATALAALLVLLPGRRKAGRRRFPAERPMIAVGLVSFLFVAQPPGLSSLLALLPGLGHSASLHRRLSLVVCFCLAYLAACTWERWRRHGLRRSAVLLAAALLAALVAWAYLAHPHPVNPQIQMRLRMGFLASHLAALAGSAWLLSTARYPAGRRVSSWALVLLVAGELFFVHRGLNPPMPKHLYFPGRPGIEFLQQNLGNDRMVGLDKTFRHNVPVIYGLADVRSGNPLQPGHLFRLTRPLRESGYGRRFVTPDHPLYDLLGVRYVVVEPGMSLDAPLSLVFDGNVRIYERPGPLPRLFLPSSARSVGGRFWKEVYEISDFAREALVVDSLWGQKSWRAADAGPSTLEILRLAATRVSARAALAEPRVLASSLYQDGGWHLLLDAEPAATVRINGPFVGAWLPPGESALELIYRPPGFLPGCLIAALALTAAFAWWIPSPVSPTREDGARRRNRPVR